MFLDRMDRSWLDHPFLTSRFRIVSERQIRKLLDGRRGNLPQRIAVTRFPRRVEVDRQRDLTDGRRLTGLSNQLAEKRQRPLFTVAPMDEKTGLAIVRAHARGVQREHARPGRLFLTREPG